MSAPVVAFLKTDVPRLFYLCPVVIIEIHLTPIFFKYSYMGWSRPARSYDLNPLEFFCGYIALDQTTKKTLWLLLHSNAVYLCCTSIKNKQFSYCCRNRPHRKHGCPIVAGTDRIENNSSFYCCRFQATTLKRTTKKTCMWCLPCLPFRRYNFNILF
jgi:hypothetical protein